MLKKRRRHFDEERYKKNFVKYPRHRMKKDKLYKARKHKSQKSLKLKKWFS